MKILCRSSYSGRKLLGEIAVEILACLNATDLNMAEKVSHDWKEAVMSGKLWQKLFKRNVSLFSNRDLNTE